MKKKLFFINQKQFGYHINFVQYCKYLKKDFDIIYLCWDYNKKRIREDGVDIIYISRKGNILQRNVRFIKSVFILVKRNGYNCIFINYFRGCSIIPLIYSRKYWIHLNIVTGSLSSKSLNRYLYNSLIRLESRFFKSVSILSDGLKKFLKVADDAYILPLGADPIIVTRQLEHKIALLYIGTFDDRRIEDTIDGLGLFIRKYPGADINYTIIGEGWNDERDRIMEKIRNNGLCNHIELKGYVPYYDLIQYYEKANIGVSYIPITPWFEYQPSTKTFEYLLAGMPVIATGTFENKKIINGQNGLIIADNPISFSDCLEIFFNRIDEFKEKLIRDSVVDYKWEIIVSKLKDYIYSQTK